MRKVRLFFLFALVALFAIVAPPAIFLTDVWLHDGKNPLPMPPAGTDDASHLNTGKAAEVIAVSNDPAEAEKQLGALVERATREGSHISISGAHHSMGGHSIYPGAIVIDMLPFNRMSLDSDARILTVGAGARWSEVIPLLDQRGFAVSIMQTNNDFSVGGSISVNCHGWQNDSPPISSTVQSFRILTASGKIEECSRTQNRELFSLALGGYGLLGVILEVKLRVVPNEYYVAEAHRVKPADYTRVYHELTRNRADVGMAYGRINVAPNAFMQDGIVTLLKRKSTGGKTTDTMTERKPNLLKRLVFRGQVDSSYGKNLRWWLEKTIGETEGKVISRNQIMNEASTLYADREPNTTEILHEYFIPSARFGEFVEKSRETFLKHRPELLNITVRNVEPDEDTFMKYAREEAFGLVMLFHQKRDSVAETEMQTMTRELIDEALACGGCYYLPYRPHATQEQFLKAYPQAHEFFAKKRSYDPSGIFENSFYLRYGKPLTDSSENN
ncbi:MAG TPA: FAD-binding oxidoreductase [Chthoniobacterales bacterium]|nr:FAD-binding oxidoreductase [Chthoniobacterales bacterium]